MTQTVRERDASTVAALNDALAKSRERHAAAVAANKDAEAYRIAKIAPVLLIVQLNRGVEMRAEKRPMLADLRQSGSLEQDADTVTMLYREGFYDPDAKNPDLTEWIVRKNRHGGLGTAFFQFKPSENRFYPVIGG